MTTPVTIDRPPQLTGRDALWCAWYLGGSQCTLPGRLLKHFPPAITQGDFAPETVAAALVEFAASPPGGAGDEERAVARLVRAEAVRMAEALTNEANRLRIAEHADIPRRVESACERTTAFLSEYGLEPPAPTVRVVDHFPEPYQDRPGAMLVADAGDRRKYGVEPGIYFARQAVRPFYSEALACHELIHVALGEAHPELMGRGLEEGIAELVGSILLSSRQVGLTPTFWIETYNRNNHVYDPFWEQYTDYWRMAHLLYRRLGLDGLMEIVAAGRPRIKELERDFATGAELPPSRQRPSRFDPRAERLAERLIHGYARTMVVSPTARLVAEHAEVGATVKEIATATGLGTETVHDALAELANQTRLIGRRADGLVVTASDLDLYRPHGMLRYRL